MYILKIQFTVEEPRPGDKLLDDFFLDCGDDCNMAYIFPAASAEPRFPLALVTELVAELEKEYSGSSNFIVGIENHRADCEIIGGDQPCTCSIM